MVNVKRRRSLALKQGSSDPEFHMSRGKDLGAHECCGRRSFFAGSSAVRTAALIVIRKSVVPAGISLNQWPQSQIADDRKGQRPVSLTIHARADAMTQLI
jgi:hypothetical protein